MRGAARFTTESWTRRPAPSISATTSRSNGNGHSNSKPPFVMVTGWNEWIAGRFGKPGGPPEFVDQFDQEFSRDIEPMQGGHGDNYYWQLISNVRRYKGAPPIPRASAAKSIRDRGQLRAMARCAAGVLGPRWRDDPP